MIETSRETVSSLLIDQLGLNVSSIHQIENGHNSRVFRVITDLGGLVLRMQAQSTNRFDIETRALERFHDTSSAVIPEVLESGALDTDSNVNFSLARLLPGVDLDLFLRSSQIPEGKKVFALRNLGYRISDLHGIESEGFGLIQDNDNGQFETIDQWSGSISQRLGRAAHLPEAEGLDIASVSLPELGSFSMTEPVLLHGDFVPRNILVDPSSGLITGIVDFEHTKSGSPELDIAYWKFFWRGSQPTDELLYGYSGQLDEQFVHKLAIVRGADALAYWLERGDGAKSKQVLTRIKQLTNVLD